MVASSFGSLVVFLVEPSQVQAQWIERMLRNLGARQIHVFVTATEALAQMLANPPGVVISSLYLPDMPGTVLVEKMRQQPSLEAVPFILVSSETRPQVLEPVRQSGACSILRKPFTEAQLARALSLIFDLVSTDIFPDDLEIEHLRILLVDDSLASRRHIRRLLEGMGIFDILEAEHGREAVELLEQHKVDLVLTDYNMPEMDGKALVEYIRTCSWQATIPILMLTSEQNEERLAAVEQAGVSAICDKPFEARSIRSMIMDSLQDH